MSSRIFQDRVSRVFVEQNIENSRCSRDADDRAAGRSAEDGVANGIQRQSAEQIVDMLALEGLEQHVKNVLQEQVSERICEQAQQRPAEHTVDEFFHELWSRLSMSLFFRVNECNNKLPSKLRMHRTVFNSTLSSR